MRVDAEATWVVHARRRAGGRLEVFPEGPLPSGGAPLVLAGRGEAGMLAWTGPHLSTMKLEALWLTEAECSVHLPLGSSRVWMV